jgi:DNA-binding response OmpR family regulator
VATILVIDDDPGINELVERVLTKQGYEVLSATNGIEGITIAEAEQPDVILLDVLMPQIGGIKILRHLRSSDRTAHIPTLIVSAAGPEVLQEIRDMGEDGADGLITKPFRQDELLAKIDELLE